MSSLNEQSRSVEPLVRCSCEFSLLPIKEMATQEVLSNRDLVRNLLSQSTEGSHILTASKSIRDAQQPCTSLYERWAERGCPTQAEGTVD